VIFITIEPSIDGLFIDYDRLEDFMLMGLSEVPYGLSMALASFKYFGNFIVPKAVHISQGIMHLEAVHGSQAMGQNRWFISSCIRLPMPCNVPYFL
jgi:hypothetical protein